MRKRSISIKGHRTRISLEPEFWTRLEAIAAARAISLPLLIAQVDRERLGKTPPPGLASALRVFILENSQRPA